MEGAPAAASSPARSEQRDIADQTVTLLPSPPAVPAALERCRRPLAHGSPARGRAGAKHPLPRTGMLLEFHNSARAPPLVRLSGFSPGLPRERFLEGPPIAVAGNC